MKRKFLIIILSVVSVVCLALGLSACGDSDSTVTKLDGVTYTLADDGTYSVTGATSRESIEIQSEIDGIAVTSIAERAFDGCSSIKNISIPDSITYIGQDAFIGCTSLNYYTYDNGYYLGNTDNNYVVLYKAKSQSITSIEIHENTKIIYCSACYMCMSLEEITIPNGVTCICGAAFSSCPLITELVIPDSVLYILDSAFGPGAIDTLTLGNSIVYIGNGAFYNCSFSSVVIPDSVTYIGGIAFSANYSLETVVLGSSVATISDSAFSDCTSLTEINIPDSVTYMGMGAFGGCTSLKSVTIGKGVNYIGVYPFRFCSSLTSINVDSDNKYFKSIDGNLYTYDGTELLQYAIGKTDTSFDIPAGVTIIGEWSVIGCTSLESVSIPDSVIIIDSESFDSCTSLKSVNIPESVTTIGYYAFINCTSLESITIPDSVVTIGEAAFANCTSLKSITVSSGNKNYKSIDGNLYSYDGTELIQYAIGKTDTYFEIPENVSIIGWYAFKGCESIVSVVIHNSVTEIGYSAFSDCDLLLYVYYNGTMEEWNNITANYSVSSNPLFFIRIYYYSETQPTESGNYWYYNSNNEIEIWTVG